MKSSGAASIRRRSSSIRTASIRVAIDRAFFHCPRAILRAQLWNSESWDAPDPVRMGKIYAAALAQPEIEEYIDTIGEERNGELWI